MCGICGFAAADPQQSVGRELLTRMAEIVRYRGPDSDGFYSAPGIGLGVRRLAINDLETGDQPISNEDGTITLVCNGEIYNFVELREELIADGHRLRTRSDVEVIVHLYEDLGPECLHRLRGMFAFALWDAPRRRLMLARDRLGIKPLHYSLGPGGCFFGSELKSILAADQIERRLDPQALRDILSFGFVTEPKTLFTQIRRLPPAHYLLYENGRAGQLRPYWHIPSPAPAEDERRTTARVWAERLREKLRESVRLHLRSDVPVGAWLSPGVDSSSIAALASRQTSQPLQTFSLAFEESACDEVGRARTLDRFPDYALSGQRVVCKAGDFALFPKAIWHTEDVMAGATAIAGLLLAESASASVKVVLTGEGSDELFGGYPWYKFEPPLRPLGFLPLPLRRLMANASVQSRWPWASRLLLGPREMSPERYARLVGPLHSEVWETVLSPELKGMLSAPDAEQCLSSHPSDFGSWRPFSQLQYYDINVRLPSAIVHQLDRASMAHSVEARVPFLDHELVELCARIPVSLKLRGWREKHILRQAMRDVLPAEIVNRPKRWLSTPNAAWLRGKLPDFALEALSEASLRSKGYFSPEPVARLLEWHRAGRANYAGQLLPIIGMQLWDELFMRSCRAP